MPSALRCLGSPDDVAQLSLAWKGLEKRPGPNIEELRWISPVQDEHKIGAGESADLPQGTPVGAQTFRGPAQAPAKAPRSIEAVGGSSDFAPEGPANRWILREAQAGLLELLLPSEGLGPQGAVGIAGDDNDDLRRGALR